MPGAREKKKDNPLGGIMALLTDMSMGMGMGGRGLLALARAREEGGGWVELVNSEWLWWQSNRYYHTNVVFIIGNLCWWDGSHEGKNVMSRRGGRESSAGIRGAWRRAPDNVARCTHQVSKF